MAKYVHRTPIRDIVGEAYTAAMGEYVAQLTVLGYEAIMYAYGEGHASTPPTYKKPVRDGKWRHRTGDLHDSFASAVYVNGVLIEDSIRYVGGTMSDKENRTSIGASIGRNEAKWYLEHPEVDVSGDVTLLCIAAMYYTKYLEEGRHKGGYKIRVISGAMDYIYANWHRVRSNLFSVKKVRIITGD
jgi:hypothetical protein